MFEVGKYYRVKTWKDGEITEYEAGQVIEVSLPLVKFKGSALIGGGEIIVNAASLTFVSAQEVE